MDGAGSDVDIASLAAAVGRLNEGLVRCRREPSDEQLRDGLILRFGSAYDLCHCTLRHFIRESAASPDDVDQMDFPDLIRTGNQQGLLLGDWPTWRRYRDARARNSHTYQAKVAQDVAEAIPGFLMEAKYLRDELLNRVG
jgi:nucleotidyltransferase substrate binding protein (TIGR01987 family)